MSLLSGQPEAEALITDRYLDAILAAHERGADHAPAEPTVDAGVRLAAGRLSTDLVRVHPSFRFEERLAARLAEAATRMRMQASGAEGVVVPVSFGLPEPAAGRGPLDDLRPHLGGSVTRPIVIGFTSAAISLAGAAYVAWRRGRVPLPPMTRAARAANEVRLAAWRGRAG